MGIPELSTQAGTIPALTDEQRHRARLSIAHHALDAADCAELLAMVGLDTPETGPESAADGSGVPTYRPDGVQKRRRAQRAIRAGSGRSAR